MRTFNFLKNKEIIAPPSEDLEKEEVNFIKVVKDLKTYGFHEAGSSKASIPVLKNNISKLYYNKITDDEDFEHRELERKKNLQKEKVDTETQLFNVNSEISEVKRKIDSIKNEITELKTRREKIVTGDRTILNEFPRPDLIGHYIGIVILIFLTAYLFLFYTSAIYNAFVFDVTQATRASILNSAKLSTTIFNPNAIIDAWDSSIFGFLFIVTSPIIFLGLGYLIYKFNESKKIWLTILILSFTFLFDSVIAYAIVEEIHQGKYLIGQGGVTEQWQFKMVWSQVPFYIILGAGFVIYIVWGVVLKFVIDGQRNLNPYSNAIKSIDSDIKDRKESENALCLELSKKDIEGQNLKAKIDKTAVDLNSQYFNKQNFENRLAEFMQGWNNWIVQGFPYEKHVRQENAETEKENFVNILYNKNLVQNAS